MADRVLTSAERNKRSPSPLRVYGLGLTDEELAYHHGMKVGVSKYSLINENVEKSAFKQCWTSYFEYDFTCLPDSTDQFTVMTTSGQGSATSSPNQTQKSFNTSSLSGLVTELGVATSGLPGPISVALVGQGAPLIHTRGATTITNRMFIDTTNDRTGTSIAVDPAITCPFTGLGPVDIRWQPVQVRFKAINATSLVEKGGSAYLMQPLNHTHITGVIDRSQMMGRGIFKAFPMCEVATGPDEWVVMEPRNGLCSFSGFDSGSPSSTLEDALAFIQFVNTTGSNQRITLIMEIDWQLAGLSVKGLAEPHIESDAASDRAKRVNSVLKTSNILPSEQKGRELIASGIAVHDNPAMQAVLSPRLLTEASASQGSHPVVKHLKEAFGHHLERLAKAGFSRLVSALEAPPIV